MNKSKQLPFIVPDFATFHDTAIAEMAYIDKPHANAQLLNQRVKLACGRAFLTGFSSPQVTIILRFTLMNINKTHVIVGITSDYRACACLDTSRLATIAEPSTRPF